MKLREIFRFELAYQIRRLSTWLPVPHEPADAGIDPYHLLIDLERFGSCRRGEDRALRMFNRASLDVLTQISDLPHVAYTATMDLVARAG